jgi:radical SAM enzyme (TIGR01210 family)
MSTQQILSGSARAKKSYTFDDAHDESVPAQMWFQDSQEGEILFLVFYSQACRWSRCLGCNLPSKMSSRHIGYKALMAQVDHVFRDARVMDRRESINKVIVSNNGSIFDQATFSTTAFMYLLAKLNLNLTHLSALSVETRPEYVDLAELEVLGRALAEGETPTTLEIALGFEAFDDHIRNDIFDKGLKLEVFERFVREMAPYGYRLKCYFMQKPTPTISDAEAVADIRNAVDYLDRIASQYPVDINMHLNPTYVAEGTMLEHAFRKGEYDPPRLRDVAEAVRHAEGKRVSVFVGLNDEGLAVEGGSFVRPGDERLIAALERFNRSQDYAALKDTLRRHDRAPLEPTTYHVERPEQSRR